MEARIGTAMTRLLMCAVMLVSMTASIEAQQPAARATVDSGLVVRAWVGDVETRGRLLAPMHAASDSVLYCRYPGPPCSVPIHSSQLGWFHPDDLDHLDVQIGNRAGKGAWVGGVIGVLLFQLGGAFAQGFCESQCPSDTDVLVGALVRGGLVGGGVGALIGSGFPRFERRF